MMIEVFKLTKKYHLIFSRVQPTLHPALSVGRSHFTFFMILFFGPHCSCPNSLVTSNMAPAHPHATSVAVYPALFFILLVLCSRGNKS